MSTKTFIKSILLIVVIAAIFQGIPQKAANWLGASQGDQSLPGPLRGLLDPSESSFLSTTGVAEFTNKQREQNGLAPLHYNLKLAKAAEAKIEDMFAQQYFEHESPNGKSPANIIGAQGYEYIVVGENLALGNFTNDEILVQAWMDSPGHRENILHNKFMEIGVAVRKGEFEGKQVWLAVQEFGSPLSSCPSPQSDLKVKIDSNRSRIASMQADLQRQKAAIDANRYENQADYNRAIVKYNNLVSQVNKLSDHTQLLVQEFNNRVNQFNECLESNS